MCFRGDGVGDGMPGGKSAGMKSAKSLGRD